MAYGAFIVGGGGTIPRIGDAIVTTVKTSPATRYKNTTWELVAQNRVPMGAGDGHEGGETVEAGLPNIAGSAIFRPYNSEYKTSVIWKCTGAFSDKKDNTENSQGIVAGDFSTNNQTFYFDASRSNPIYGASTTVQPPAYYFYFWRRVS